MANWLKAVLPARPLFDKICALCVLIENVTGMLAWPTEGFSIEFWQSNDSPAQERKDRWATEKAYLIDVGDNDYKRRGKGSATETTALDLGIDLKARADLRWLVEITTRNNQTGYLKGFAHDLNAVYLIRELYKPGSFTNVNTAIEATTHVIFTELRFRQMQKDKYVRHANEMATAPLSALQVPSDQSQPFTVYRYMMQMFCLGDDMAEIERHIKFWLKAKNQADAMNRRATHDAKDRAEFRQIRNFKVAVIETDNDRLARSLLTAEHAPVFVIVKDSRGGVVILSNREHHNAHLRNSLRQLTTKLQEGENNGAVWAFNEPFMALMNSSRDQPGKPTSHSVDTIVKLIGSHARFE